MRGKLCGEPAALQLSSEKSHRQSLLTKGDPLVDLQLNPILFVLYAEAGQQHEGQADACQQD